MKRFFANSNGYGLIETLIVVAFLGIVLAMVAPNFSKWSVKRKINGESQKLYFNLQLARASAAKNNNNVIFTFIPGENSYKVHDDTDGDGSEAGETVKLVNLDSRVQYGFFGGSIIDVDGNSNSAAVALAGGGNVITFDSRGQASSSGSVYLIHGGDAGETNDRLRAVSIVGETGGVDLWKYDGGLNPPWK